MVAAALLLLAGGVVAETAPASTLAGTVRVTKGMGNQQLVAIKGATESVRVEGELVREIQQLQSAVVEVVGTRNGDKLVVLEYRIVDIGGGVKPLVGLLAVQGSGFALDDGDGSDIPLSLPPRARERLSDKAGAKLWVHGPRLPSGELKVLKYGILREAKPPETATP
jgi:hypothetical protein